MKWFIRSRLFHTLIISMILLASAIIVPFSFPLLHSHAASQASWNIVPSPSSGTGNGDTLKAVAKISDNDVWAVGFDGSNTLTEHWDGSAWSIVSSPSVGQSKLYGVTAVSTNDVWAVGTKTTNSYNDPQTLVMHWDGTQWTIVDSPNPAPYVNRLYAVTVVSSNDVWAAGEKADFSTSADPRQFATYQTLIEHWDGTSWTAVTSPNDLTTQNNLFAITAVSATDIWAVGNYACGSIQPLTLHYNGTNWSIITSPSIGTSNCFQYSSSIDSTLIGVTATASNDVWAVGSSQVEYTANVTSLIMHWDGTQWTIVTSPNVPNTPTHLRGVTAISANDIWAVGEFENPTGAQPLTMHYDGTNWTIVSSVSPSGNSVLFGTVAVGTNDVWAVGNDISSSASLIEHYASSMIPLSITVNPTQGSAGTTIAVTGSNWTPGDVVDISLSTSTSVLTKATVASDGTITISFTVPQNAALGTQFVNAKDETTGQTTQASFTVIRGKLFILLQGIDSQLSSNDVGTTLGSIGSTLEKTFPEARFFDYSYKGSQTDGTPQPYTCGPTFTSPILNDIQLLNTQITHAVGKDQNTDIYLIGHSLGGVIAFGYLALLEDHLNGISLPAGAQLKAVVTLDSPLGGVRGERYAFFSKFIATTQTKLIPNYPCDDLVGTKTPLLTVDDLVKIYDSSSNGRTTLPDDPGNDPLGAKASIEAISSIILPSGRPFLLANDNLALAAHTDLGTSLLSVGNIGDFLWHPASCSPFLLPISPALAAVVGTIPDFTDTQFLEEQGDGSGVYSRFINTAMACDGTTLTNGLNHSDVLTNASVLNGLVTFLSPVGSTPNPLVKEPYQS